MSNVHHAVEAAKTVVEVAELAWSAVDRLHHHHDHDAGSRTPCLSPEDFDSLRSENRRLRQLLERNLQLLEKINQSPALSSDFSSDLHDRLVSAVDSESFLSLSFLSKNRQLQKVRISYFFGYDLISHNLPISHNRGADFDVAEIMVNVDKEEPSWWVWVTDEMVPGTVEERSEIDDDDSYVIVWEEHVVDGVANFIARCIVSNPKSQKLTPEELQKTIAKSLDGVNKFEKMLSIWHAGKTFYALSTWGLALAGLYRSRGILTLAAKGVHTTGKLVMRAL